MTPIYQTDRSVTSGDCLQAALASVLELPLEAVPHFSRDTTDETFFDVVRQWLLREHGLYVMCFPESFWAESQPVYCLLQGRTRNGIDHITVAYEGRIVHDPMGPDSPTLRDRDVLQDRTYWFFIASDPAQQRVMRTAA